MINLFAPNTIIKSAEMNANWNNFSNHGRNFTMKFFFPSTLTVENGMDYVSLPDAGTIERIDIVCVTAPTGASIIADVEYSDDSGGSWTSILSAGNRPTIVASGKAGNTTTINTPSVEANTRLYRAVVDQIGSTIAGADLTVLVKGKYDVD